jgi:hypothetical protein
VQEASRNWHLIQTHWDAIIKDYQPWPEVAIVADQDNGLFTFAMNGNEEASTESFRGYYRALWNLDLWCDCLEPSQLGKKDYKVLVVPWHLTGKKETCDQLRHFVQNGGTLILETGFGLYDDRFFYNPMVPPHGLHEAFGYREQESFYVHATQGAKPVISSLFSGIDRPAEISASDRIYYNPELEFQTPLNLRIKGHTFITPVEIISATPIARCKEFPVAVTKQVGKGQVYYIGTNLGASIAAGDDEGIRLLRAIIYSAVSPPVSSNKLRPRLLEGKSQSLLAVFNDTTEDHSETIKLPVRYSGLRSAKDLHRGTDFPLEQSSLQVTVPYQDVVVVLLR